MWASAFSHLNNHLQKLLGNYIYILWSDLKTHGVRGSAFPVFSKLQKLLENMTCAKKYRSEVSD